MGVPTMRAPWAPQTAVRCGLQLPIAVRCVRRSNFASAGVVRATRKHCGAAVVQVKVFTGKL